MTEPQVADLVRAFAPYAWPAATVLVVLILRRALSRAIARLVERLARMGVKTQAGQVSFDFGEVTKDAKSGTELLAEVKKQLPPE